MYGLFQLMPQKLVLKIMEFYFSDKVLKGLEQRKLDLDRMEVNFLEEEHSAYVAGEKLEREIAHVKRDLFRLGYYEQHDYYTADCRPPFRCPCKFQKRNWKFPCVPLIPGVIFLNDFQN